MYTFWSSNSFSIHIYWDAAYIGDPLMSIEKGVVSLQKYEELHNKLHKYLFSIAASENFLALNHNKVAASFFFLSLVNVEWGNSKKNPDRGGIEKIIAFFLK